jgi:hypothetical protein
LRQISGLQVYSFLSIHSLVVCLLCPGYNARHWVYRNEQERQRVLVSCR